MSYQKINDVMAVLRIIKREFKGLNTTELRKYAVESIAESELQAPTRYTYNLSAKKAFHSACARRLKPDIANIEEFDALVDRWLREGSMRLRDILKKHSTSISQRVEIDKLFGTK